MLKNVSWWWKKGLKREYKSTDFNIGHSRKLKTLPNEK